MIKIDAARQLGYYIIDDIYNLPDGQRAELIDGELYMMATTNTNHQRLVKEFTYLIEDYIRRNKGDCEVLPSPFAAFLNADDTIYLEPSQHCPADNKKYYSQTGYNVQSVIFNIEFLWI